MELQKISIVFRLGFMAILAIVCFVASSFMVLESSEFFERFYQSTDSKNFGFISALLNEVFLVIMAAVWVPAIRKGEVRKFHPANILIKGLVILLFINTVGGASLNTVQKKLNNIQEQKNRIEVLRILQSQIEDQQENISTFKGQNQRVNTVLATRKLDEVKEELKSLQSNQQSALSLWLDIFFITLVRFTIQLANITAVWLAGWLYRSLAWQVKSDFIDSQNILPKNTFHEKSAKNIRLQQSDLKPIKKKRVPTKKDNNNFSTQQKKLEEDNNNFSTQQKKSEEDNNNLSTQQKKSEEDNNFSTQEEELEKKELFNTIKNSLSDLNDPDALSRELGISTTNIQRLKNGQHTDLELVNLQKIQKKINLMRIQGE